MLANQNQRFNNVLKQLSEIYMNQHKIDLINIKSQIFNYICIVIKCMNVFIKYFTI